MGRHSSKRRIRARTGTNLIDAEVPERLRDEVARRRQRRRRINIISLIVTAVVLSAAIAAAAIGFNTLVRRFAVKDDAGKVIQLDLEPQLADTPYNLLILGYDLDEEGTSRSDTIILARVDEQLGKVWLVSIPRDTLADIPGYGEEKINAAYALGGPQLAVDTVEELTGTTIHNYIGIELEGFIKLVNALGGIEVDVPMDIEPGESPNEDAISAGLQVLDGYQALWFVRTRMQFADSDLSRVKNQQLFLRAVADQASRTPVTRLLGVVDAVSSMVETNMSVMQLARMTRALRSIGSDNMYTATIPIYIEDPYLMVLEPDFTEFMRQFNAGEPIGVEPVAEEEGLDGTTTADGADKVVYPADILVDIRNGSARNGLAAQASTLLQSAGFAIGEVGNVVNPGSYQKTYVVYQTNKSAGELVASHLQPGVEVRPSGGAYSFEGDVLIVIGTDWNLESIPVSQN